jgi:hypothetical protein
LVAGSLLAACSPHSGTTSAVPPAVGQQQPLDETVGQVHPPHYIPPSSRLRTAQGNRHTLSQCSNFPCNLNSPLTWYGGPWIQHRPHFYLVFWGWHNVAPFDPGGMAPYVQNFAAGLSGTSYMNILSQYYSTAQGYIQNIGGEYGGSFFDDGSTPNNPSNDQVYTEALTGLHVFGDQSQDANYIVLTPTGHNQSGSFSSFCGWHTYKTFAPGSSLIFSYIPYMPDDPNGYNPLVPNCLHANQVVGPLDGASMALGHEIAEAQTDPFPNTGWIDGSNGMQNEVGDKCAGGQYWRALTLGSQRYAVQELWSNASMAAQGGDGCVLSYAPSGPPMTCTPDGYGYCLQQVSQTSKLDACGVYDVTTVYGLYKSGVYQNQYTEKTGQKGKYCADFDTWTPINPSTDVGDPNLI